MSATHPAITWTIAGSDSGGGAGIQADLLTMHDLGSHGCSVITAITAQNSMGVSRVEYSSREMIDACLQSLSEDLPARTIKLGMLGTKNIIDQVASFLMTYEGRVVCDPVMISTSGSALIDSDSNTKLVSSIFPRTCIITPNKFEAEELIGTRIINSEDVIMAALELLSTGTESVLIKGGHYDESGALAQDYWTDGKQSFWLSSPRINNLNTHGTGCSLSSAIAACLTLGYDIQDSIVISKCYVSQGISVSKKFGGGPGPVAHKGWPSNHLAMPWLTKTSVEGLNRPLLPECHRNWNVYPIVDSSNWVEKLVHLGIKDIQLRIKDLETSKLAEEIRCSQLVCENAGARLWVNDHWKLAIEYGTYGVHMGQEDLQEQGEFHIGNALSSAGLRLGISTHSYTELARALSVRPSYISLGPIFQTYSKNVNFSPRGILEVKRWRSLIPPNLPLIAIGGISLDSAPAVLSAGAEGIAVISALTKTEDVKQAVDRWQSLWKE